MAEEKTGETMPTRSHSVAQVAGVVSLYWIVSISMIFANKYLVGGRASDTDVSLFVAWIQCLSSVAMAVIANAFRRRFLGQDVSLPSLNWKFFSNRDVIVLCCMFTGMLSFNNLCLKHVGVSFFQVARSMTLIFTVILSGFILRKIASCRIWCCCLLVASGFVLGVDQEKLAGTLSVRGVIYGITTSFFVSMNGVFTKRVLEQLKGNTVAVVFYMNIGASVLFIPLMIGTGQLQSGLVERATDPLFMMMLMISGFLSFFIGVASNLQIDFTSPVTHHISNNAKSVFQTLIAVMAFSEVKSMLWWCSNLLVIAGALSYTYTRMQEDKAEKSAQKSVSVEPANTGEKNNGKELV